MAVRGARYSAPAQLALDNCDVPSGSGFFAKSLPEMYPLNHPTIGEIPKPDSAIDRRNCQSTPHVLSCGVTCYVTLGNPVV